MLDRIKRDLRIIGEDEDEIVEDLIEDAKANLSSITGVEVDFIKYPLARKLLKDHCRYDYNNAIEFFEDNFRSDIIRLQMMIAGDELEKASNAESEPSKKS